MSTIYRALPLGSGGNVPGMETINSWSVFINNQLIGNPLRILQGAWCKRTSACGVWHEPRNGSYYDRAYASSRAWSSARFHRKRLRPSYLLHEWRYAMESDNLQRYVPLVACSTLAARIIGVLAFASVSFAEQLIGTVVDDTGAGIGQAQVEMVSRNADHPLRFQALSSRNGSFTIDAPSGTYKLLVNASGFLSFVADLLLPPHRTSSYRISLAAVPSGDDVLSIAQGNPAFGTRAPLMSTVCDLLETPRKGLYAAPMLVIGLLGESEGRFFLTDSCSGGPPTSKCGDKFTIALKEVPNMMMSSPDLSTITLPRSSVGKNTISKRLAIYGLIEIPYPRKPRDNSTPCASGAPIVKLEYGQNSVFSVDR